MFKKGDDDANLSRFCSSFASVPPLVTSSAPIYRSDRLPAGTFLGNTRRLSDSARLRRRKTGRRKTVSGTVFSRRNRFLMCQCARPLAKAGQQLSPGPAPAVATALSSQTPPRPGCHSARKVNGWAAASANPIDCGFRSEPQPRGQWRPGPDGMWSESRDSDSRLRNGAGSAGRGAMPSMLRREAAEGRAIRASCASSARTCPAPAGGP